MRSPGRGSFFITMKQADPYYKTKKWERLRAAALRRDGYMCQIAKREGHSIPARCVHHIFPRDTFPEYQNELWNLISLSYEAHNTLHDRNTNELTEEGEALRMQTALAQGIETRRTTLVIGNPGAGKTTYVWQHLGNGMVYDLDAIAGALRLRPAKAERFKPARLLANSLLQGFADAAHRYVADVFVIRTAPTREEFDAIAPTKLVAIYGNYGSEELTEERRHSIARRIRECVDAAKRLGIEVEEIER